MPPLLHPQLSSRSIPAGEQNTDINIRRCVQHRDIDLRSMNSRSINLLGVLVLIMAIITGCAGTRIQKLSGPEFLEEAKHTDEMNSFFWTSYIGNSYQRAYLEYGHAALIGKGAIVTVYWTPISELPSNIVEQIKTRVPPWTNWSDKVGQPVR